MPRDTKLHDTDSNLLLANEQSGNALLCLFKVSTRKRVFISHQAEGELSLPSCIRS